MTSIIQKIAGRDIVDIDKDYSEFGHVGISEDHLQSLPLLDKCKRAVFLDTPFVYYRANSDSMTRIISFEKSRNGVWSKISVFKEEKKVFKQLDNRPRGGRRCLRRSLPGAV